MNGWLSQGRPLPRRLRPGDCIGIASPSRWLAPDALERTVTLLEETGFVVQLGSAARLRDHQYAGTFAERARELHELFDDGQVAAILCSRGGYGATRVSDLLDYERIRRNPKALIGFSDITVLHTAIARERGAVTFHGPMLNSFKDGADPYSWTNLLSVLGGELPGPYPIPSDMPQRIVRPGVGEGPLFGGNLTLLNHLIGTRWDFDTAGTILFLEDWNEKLYSLDRMFVQFRRAGRLERVRGLLVGEIAQLSDEEIPFGRSVEEIVLDACEGLDIPIVTNVPCGHGLHQMTLPIGIRARLDCAGASPLLSLLEPAVR